MSSCPVPHFIARFLRNEEQSLESRIEALKKPVGPEQTLNARRILELANTASFLYLTQNTAERGSLLKSVLLNCHTDGVTVTPPYRKPFDLIFQSAKKTRLVGARGFEPPTPWSRTTKLKTPSASFGVA